MLGVTKRGAARASLTALSLAALSLTAPHASASDGNTAAKVAISSEADAGTRAIAAAEPRALAATGTLCGSGYALYSAERLPDERRWGTLFIYNQTDGEGVCAVFDNNLSTTKYMKLKVCDYKVSPTCVTDEGNFTQYAGPVRMQVSTYCATAIAIMKNTKTSTTALIDRKVDARPCN
ncbi:hypothetical protein ACFVX6_17525 [Streptomyces sp. NPDC058289]|uniref:hypothetical protein n=1 Tax=Streptomyces sp. NPDC058289 TaxID=3346425 RepID=UPI0036EE5191